MSEPGFAKITFTLNGQERSISVHEDRSLLSMLREDFDIVSPKSGCAPTAQCGCCTVWIDERPRKSCAIKAHEVDGRSVTTLEGLAPEIRHNVADAFSRAGAVQCGFCTPGIAMRTVKLVENNPKPSREEIAHGLRGHLCRCTGYAKIFDAVEDYAARQRGESVDCEADSGRIGTALPKYAGYDAVLGQKPFVDDMKMPGMLRGVLCFSQHPRALVKDIDVTKAASYPGVRRVVTAADVPGERYIGLIEQDWPVLVAVGEETRCVGDVLAVVVAETVEAARKAVELVDVVYEVRKPVTEPKEALKPDAHKVHPKGNLLDRGTIRRGDVDAAFAASTHVVEHTFYSQRIEHLFMEPESCLAAPTPDGLHVWSPGQGVFDDRRQIAKILGWEEDRICVELVSNGGAFGGKEDLSVQGQAALAAMLCDAPVKITLSRPESLRLHPKRHPVEMQFKVGCDAKGRLTAVRARCIGDTGAYASVGAKVLERTAGHTCGPYIVPNIDSEAMAVYTNNPPSGAMRGFGVNQAAFAIETCLDMLAEKVGIDGWDIRWLNIMRRGDTFVTGQRMTKPFGLDKTLEAVKEVYKSEPYAGIACGIKNVGIGNGMIDYGKASIKVEDDGTATIRTGFTEMGQGLFTVCVQFACEVTGLPPRCFHATTDTTRELNCGQTTASRGTVLAGNAVIPAAQQLKADLDTGKTLEDLVGKEYFGNYACTDTTKLGDDVPEPKTHLTYGFATQVVILDEKGVLKKVVAAHDVGRVINPKLLAGQIEGAVHMGLGYALTEDFPCVDGHPQHLDMNSCGIIRPNKMPEVEVMFVEEPDPECPFGARGVGEIGLVPVAGATAGAIYRFEGKRRFRLPMRDTNASRAIWDRSFKP